MTPDPKPIEAMKLAFIVDIAHWPEGRCVIYSHSESMACSYACQSAKEAGYNVDRSEFSAKRSPEYDRFASELKRNWGYDFEYLQGRIFSRLDELERNHRTPDLDAEGAAMREALQQTLRQWKMYAEDRDEEEGDLENADHLEAQIYRRCKTALASTAGAELLERLKRAEEELAQANQANLHLEERVNILSLGPKSERDEIKQLSQQLASVTAELERMKLSK